MDSIVWFNDEWHDGSKPIVSAMSQSYMHGSTIFDGARAYNNKVPLFIDAEESWIQTAIDEIVRDMMQKFNREKAWIFNTMHFLIDLVVHDR